MDFTQLIKTVFGRLGEFFDILDLSFFVAGAISVAALAVEVHLLEREAVEQRTGVALQEKIDRGAAASAAKAQVTAGEAKAAQAKSIEEVRRVDWTNALTDLSNAEAGAAREGAALREANTRGQHALALDAIAVAEGELTGARTHAALAEAEAAAERVEPKSVLQRFVFEANLLLLFVGIYVGGLICFAVGRLLRQSLLEGISRVPRKPKEEQRRDVIKRAIESHNLWDDPLVTKYREPVVEGADNDITPAHAGALYGRLWVELRESKREQSYGLVRRYWVLAATYDGVGTALLFWTLLLVQWGWFMGTAAAPTSVMTTTLCMVAAAMCVMATVACYREARKFTDHQAYEMIAILAHGGGVASEPDSPSA